MACRMVKVRLPGLTVPYMKVNGKITSVTDMEPINGATGMCTRENGRITSPMVKVLLL